MTHAYSAWSGPDRPENSHRDLLFLRDCPSVCLHHPNPFCRGSGHKQRRQTNSAPFQGALPLFSDNQTKTHFFSGFSELSQSRQLIGCMDWQETSAPCHAGERDIPACSLRSITVNLAKRGTAPLLESTILLQD